MGIRRVRAAALAMLLSISTCAYSASKTVLVLGDSLSAEYGIARGSGWVSLLEKKLQLEKIDATVVNASISGETTSGGRSRLSSALAREKPDVVIIELGGNDGLRGLPLSSTESNLRAMINAANKEGAAVLLVGMRIPPNYGKEYTEKFFGTYKKLAQEAGTALVPFLLEGVATKPDLMQADRIHPRAGAQEILLQNVWPHLRPLLKK